MRRRIKIKWWSFVIVFWACLPGFSGMPGSNEILDRVAEKLTSIGSLRAKFEETFFWKLTGEKQSIQGSFLLKGENLFRIQIPDQEIVSDGKRLWTYQKPTHRVVVDQLESSENTWLPQKLFLQTRKDYRHRTVGEETVQGRKCYIIDFVGEREDLYIIRMKVWIDQETWLPLKIEQIDASKNRIVYVLSEMELGITMEDGTFQFHIPEGAEIIDLTE